MCFITAKEVVLLDALLIDGDRVPYCLGPAGVEVAKQRVELADA